MRYEKSQSLLRLAFEMQGSAEGVSLQNIMETYEVSRRTAERMRDAVREVFPQVEEFNLGDGLKRWRIRSTKAISATPVLPGELAALYAAALQFRQNGRDTQAAMLDSVSAKLRSLLRVDDLRRLAPDYEALVEAEGLALHPGPHPKIDHEVFAALQEAIKACEEIILDYLSRSTGQKAPHRVRPYGFLYGHRHYLLAYDGESEAGGFRLFSLGNILGASTTGTIFDRDPGFSLHSYAANSFGVYQEDPVDVVWHVSAQAADDAQDYIFHPTQRFKKQADGSLILTFRAGGLVEMAWHLFTWGGQIKAIEPPELLATIDKMTEAFIDAHPQKERNRCTNSATNL